MKTYIELEGVWETPHGHPVAYRYRQDTNDWNTLSSIHAPSDEYHLPTGISGWAVDIGGYLGGVGICLALDNPELQVIIVEPVPDNARLIRVNVTNNGVADRVRVLEAAAAGPDDETALIRWGYYGNESIEHHAFVGNINLVESYGGSMPHTETEVSCYSLSGLLNMAGVAEFAYLKIDCEGCEFAVLSDPAVARVERIVGEWHPTHGATQQTVLDLLSPTHDVTWDGPFPQGPQGFIAVRR